MMAGLALRAVRQDVLDVTLTLESKYIAVAQNSLFIAINFFIGNHSAKYEHPHLKMTKSHISDLQSLLPSSFLWQSLFSIYTHSVKK